MYYTISQNKTAHVVIAGKKTQCGLKVRPEWAKCTKTEEPKCEKCLTKQTSEVE